MCPYSRQQALATGKKRGTTGKIGGKEGETIQDDLKGHPQKPIFPPISTG